MAKKVMYKKARSCKHALQVTPLGGVFVKASCPNDAVMKLPSKTMVGNFTEEKKLSYVMAKRCELCEFYKKSGKK